MTMFQGASNFRNYPGQLLVKPGAERDMCFSQHTTNYTDWMPRNISLVLITY